MTIPEKDNPAQRSDADLIHSINSGDPEAFEELYFRYRDWVIRLARRFTGNDADALDVLQETFSYLLRKVPHLRLTAAMTTFLYPVVKNLSLAALRRRGRFSGAEEVMEQLAAPPDPPAAGSRADLAAALGVLPAAQREVLLLRFADDLSLEKIAACLGIPLGTVKSRLHNALATLRADPRTRDYFSDP